MKTDAAWQSVWSTPFYRAALISLVLSGIGISSVAPQLTRFFVNELGASLSQASLYYLTNLAAPIVGFALGRYADRLTDRLPLMRICAGVGTVAWLAMAGATSMWMPFVISIVALSVAGAAGALLFAAVRDQISRDGSPAGNRITSAVRMGFTAGWIIGPVWGSWFDGVFGLRGMLVTAGLLQLASILPMIGMRVPRYVVTSVSVTTAEMSDRRAMVPLVLFTGLCTVLMSGDTLKFSFLPIYMEQDLGVSSATRGR